MAASSVSTAARAPGARFIDPQVLSRIGNLELIARTVVNGFISGLHRSPLLGLSIDFAEHRGYEPGDDVRRIDWRVYARTDRLYIKETESDTNANFSILLDTSKSMAFSSRTMSKLDYARFAAASLAYLSNRQRDRVGLVTFDDDLREIVPPSAKHFETVLHTLDRLEPGAQSRLDRPLKRVAEIASLRRRGVMVLLSDLYEPPEQVLRALTELRLRGNDLLVFHILDPAEVNFDYNDAANFEDLETGERLAVLPEQFRAEYRKRVQNHIDSLQKLLGDGRIDYAFFDTSQPLDHLLFRYLSDRQRLGRTR